MSELIKYNVAGAEFYCTAEQRDVIETLSSLNKGGIGTVYGYKPSTGYVTPPVKNMQIITRFSLERLYQRKQIALNAISFDDVAPIIAKDPVLSALSVREQRDLFNERKDGQVASMQKTLDGVRDDSHRQGHDRCYARVTEGVKVHYKTEKGIDKLMHPVLTDGLPVAQSIMVGYLELSSETVTEGERAKAPNSGAPVRMGNAIESLLNKRSVGYRTLSLKADNFSHMKVSRKTISREDLMTESQIRDSLDVFLEALGLD